MTSQADICNLALSDVGTRSTISSLDDPSEEAVQCKLWYDRQRRALLRTAPWGFCRSQLSLSQIGDAIPDNTAPFPWLYKYDYPSDAIKFRYILPPAPPQATGIPVTGTTLIGPSWCGPSRYNRFIITSDKNSQGQTARVLVSNIQQAIGVYNADITNPDQFDDLFVIALAAALSYKLVIPLSGNVGEKQSFQAAAMQAITDARVADSNEAITSNDPKVDWIETRGIGGPFGYGGMNNDIFGWGNWLGGWDTMSWSN